MAKSTSDEELQLKKRARRRLVGAIALVTVVAVFLPMVLDHEPKPTNHDVSIQIPSPNAGIFTSKIVPVPAIPQSAKNAPPPPAVEAPAKPALPKVAAASPTTAAAATPDANDTEAAPPKAAAEKPKSAEPVKSAPPPKVVEKAKAPDTAPAAPANGGYVVQVAALNDAGKAKQMEAQLSKAGLKAYTEVVPTSKGAVTRVRAGPFVSREEADKARDKLKDIGLSGNVIPK